MDPEVVKQVAECLQIRYRYTKTGRAELVDAAWRRDAEYLIAALAAKGISLAGDVRDVITAAVNLVNNGRDDVPPSSAYTDVILDALAAKGYNDGLKHSCDN